MFSIGNVVKVGEMTGVIVDILGSKYYRVNVNCGEYLQVGIFKEDELSKNVCDLVGGKCNNISFIYTDPTIICALCRCHNLYTDTKN